MSPLQSPQQPERSHGSHKKSAGEKGTAGTVIFHACGLKVPCLHMSPAQTFNPVLEYGVSLLQGFWERNYISPPARLDVDGGKSRDRPGGGKVSIR